MAQSYGIRVEHGGSGEADLALNILLKTSGDRDFSAQHHLSFKWQFVAKPPAEGGKISSSEVLAWIEERRLAPAGNVNGQDS